MHIVILFEFSSLNGGEHSMLSIIRTCSGRQKFQFSALVPEIGPLADELRRLGCSVSGFAVRDALGKKRPAVEVIDDLRERIVALQPDLVHANSLSMCRLLGQTADSLPRGIRLTGHIRDIMKISQKAVADLNRLDQIVAVSRATQFYHVRQGLAHNRSTVIYNGVDTTRFSKRPQLEARQQLIPELPSEAKMILNVGQICLRKGQLDLARAVVDLLHDRNDVYLISIGKRHSSKRESQEYEQEITETFRAAERSEHLYLQGYRDDIADWMNAADLLVHSAHQEPFGRVLLEAAASELPIVATSVGGTLEMLKPGQDALIVPPGNPAALATAISSVLDDRTSSEDVAASARRAIEAEFSLPAAAGNLAAFWRTCGRIRHQQPVEKPGARQADDHTTRFGPLDSRLDPI